MTRFLVSIALIALGLTIGQILQVNAHSSPESASALSLWIRRIQMFALFVINPVITLGAFWLVRLDNPAYLVIPLLGLAALVLGGICGLFFSGLLKHTRKKKGAMFVSSSFTNLGNFGGLICFVFFGEGSFAFVSMYKLFEEFFYYLIGYPVAKWYGTPSSREAGVKNSAPNPFLRLVTDPFILVYFISISIGIALNFSGFPRPDFYKPLNGILIPLSSVFLVVSVGFKMRFKAMRDYRAECLLVALIKFAIIPLAITGTAYFLGIGSLADGMILKVILVLSAMSPAFNSLIPPQIYDLDADLANSCWIFCTLALVLVIPVIFFFVQLI